MKKGLPTANVSDYVSNASLVVPAVQLYNTIRKTQPRRPSVGVCLEGDTTLRLDSTLELYKTGRIRHIIVSGSIDDPLSDNLPAAIMKRQLVDKGVPLGMIDLEEKSEDTHDHPLYVVPIAKRRGFRDLIIITSGYHVLRAYLRFLAVVSAEDYPFTLYGYPAGSIGTWFRRSPTERQLRIALFFNELTKIRTYDGLASFERARQYLRSLEYAR